jgi:Helix-turn-helix domain
MSAQAFSWVVEKSQHKGSALLLMLMIANHAHSDGTNAFPSIELLAKECRMSPRAIQYILSKYLIPSGELVAERHVRKEKSGAFEGRNTYFLPGVVRDGFHILGAKIARIDGLSANFACSLGAKFECLRAKQGGSACNSYCVITKEPITKTPGAEQMHPVETVENSGSQPTPPANPAGVSKPISETEKKRRVYERDRRLERESTVRREAAVGRGPIPKPVSDLARQHSMGTSGLSDADLQRRKRQLADQAEKLRRGSR